MTIMGFELHFPGRASHPLPYARHLTPAQLTSVLATFLGVHMPTDPDQQAQTQPYTAALDAVIDTVIREAATPDEAFTEAVWELCAFYDIPVTNNTPRHQDGRWLHAAGDFMAHLRKIMEVRVSEPVIINRLPRLKPTTRAASGVYRGRYALPPYVPTGWRNDLSGRWPL